MEIIVTHTNTDFDALSSLILASKLYPEAQLVLPGSCEQNVRDFLTQYPHEFNLKKSKHIKLDKVTKLILVDTCQLMRLGKFQALTDGKIPIHIYDHHPSQEGDIKGELMEIREIGATASIILEKIKENNLILSSLEATIAALGIYEDTGSLTFPTTTSTDIFAVAYLISCNADLSIIARFLEKELTFAQIFILKELLSSQEVHQIGTTKVVIAKVEIDKYVGDLSILVHKIMDMESIEVLFCLMAMEERVHLIARSRTEGIDVGEILAEMGGGGHKTAASATIRDLTLDAAQKILLKILNKRLDTTGEVITTNEIITYLHPRNFKHLMNNLPQPVQDILKLVGKVGDMLKVNVYVVGGFVRDLILRKPTFDVDIVVEGDGIEFAKKLTQLTPGYYKTHERFKTAKVIFAGGITSNGFKIDIASTRQETYEHPAALPTVVSGGIYHDLLRRDFTINALAIQLNLAHYGDLIDFVRGETDLKEGVIRVMHDESFIDDPTRIFRAVRFTSRGDTSLGGKIFKLDDRTKELIIQSATKELFERLANQRIRNEFILILNDDNPSEAIFQLQEFGILKYVHPSLQFKEREEFLFKKIAHTFFYLELIISHKPLERWLIYLLALIDKLSKEDALEFMRHLKFTKLQQKTVIKDKEISRVLIEFLKTHKEPNLSDLYQLLTGVPLEVLVFIMAKADAFEGEEIASCIKKHLIFFLTELSMMKLSITGDDLKKLGIEPGPVYKEILDKVLVAKLDGKLKTKEDELRYIKDYS